MMEPNAFPLTREEVSQVIEGRGAARRIPMAIHQWIDPARFGERQAEYKQILARYPSDVRVIDLRIPDIFSAPADNPSYRWLNYDNPFPPNTPFDAVSALDDWDKLDGVLRDFPDPHYPGLIPDHVPADDGIYRLGRWWYWLFERLWSVRGMENALCDFYENGPQVHRFFRALTDFYKVMLTRAKHELALDGVMTSDDIGMQTAAFFSVDIFREFFKPYYAELIAHAHSLGMHFWLHSCGNIEAFLPDLIEIGLDVVHPIQKYSMQERRIAELYGEKLCIWAGMDVQRTIPFGTPEDVRREVRFLIETYWRPSGRLMIAAGNNMTADTTKESLEAFLNETLTQGTEIASRRG